MEFTFTFLKTIFKGLYHVAPILIMMFIIIATLGVVVGRLESWGRFKALYWSAITALTVGYGDITPRKKASRVLAAFIALLGIMTAGIVVSITVEATSHAFDKHVRPELHEIPPTTKR